MSKNIFGLVSSYLIELSVISLIIFSPLIYAGVTILPLSVIETLSFLAVAILLIKAFISGKSLLALGKVYIFPFLIFILLGILHLIRFPFSTLLALSPGTVSLYSQFGTGTFKDIPLSIYPDATVSILLQALAFFSVFFVVSNYADTQKKINRFVGVIIFSGIIYSIYGIIRRIYTPDAAFSTFTNRNHFASYLLMIIPLALAYSLLTQEKIKRFTFVFLTSIMAVGLFLTWSRMGRICFILSTCAYFVLLRLKKPFGKAFIIIVILLLFLTVFVGLLGFASLMNRMETTSALIKGYSHRVDAALDSLRIFKDFPVFGTGLGTFAEIAQKYKTNLGQASYVFSHNEPFQLLAEAGIAGFILIALFLIFCFKSIISGWIKRRNSYSVSITTGCIVGLSAVLVHSFADFVFHIPAVYILFAIVLGIAVNVSRLSRQEDAISLPQERLVRPGLGNGIFLSGILILIIFASSVVISRLRGQLVFESVGNIRIAGANVAVILEYRRALKGINKAIAFNPLNSSYFIKKGDLLSDLASREEVTSELSLLEEFGDKDRLLLLAKKAYEQAISINPTRADYHLRLGWVYASQNELGLATDEFNKAVLLDPTNKKIKSYITNFQKSFNMLP